MLLRFLTHVLLPCGHLQGRNKVGQIGYIPEKYLLVLDSMGNEQRSGSWREGPSETALDRELTNIMNTELVLEPGGGWLAGFSRTARKGLRINGAVYM